MLWNRNKPRGPEPPIKEMGDITDNRSFIEKTNIGKREELYKELNRLQEEWERLRINKEGIMTDMDEIEIKFKEIYKEYDKEDYRKLTGENI